LLADSIASVARGTCVSGAPGPPRHPRRRPPEPPQSALRQ
jgi:hypothetical protein